MRYKGFIITQTETRCEAWRVGEESARFVRTTIKAIKDAIDLTFAKFAPVEGCGCVQRRVA